MGTHFVSELTSESELFLESSSASFSGSRNLSSGCGSISGSASNTVVIL